MLQVIFPTDLTRLSAIHSVGFILGLVVLVLMRELPTSAIADTHFLAREE